jgi:RsiW-degrading membrane proteinase PrsW (M82 family)
MPPEPLLPLQGLFTPTKQIPICVPVLSFCFWSLPLLPSLPLSPVPLPLIPPEVEPEDACAFIIIIDTDNESRLSPITENKNMKMTLLLALFIAFFVIEIALIVSYICRVKNKQSKNFKVNICTIFFAIKLVKVLLFFINILVPLVHLHTGTDPTEPEEFHVDHRR